MSLIKSIIIILISLLISLFIVEFILSNVKPVQIRSDPNWVADGYTRGHYEPYQKIRGSIGHNITNIYGRKQFAEYSLNKYGFRGDDWNEELINSIIFFGGSSTFSFHDNDDQTWVEIATNCKSESLNKKIQPINLSHPGFSIFDAPHLFLQKGSHYEFNTVVVNHLWNDIKFISALTTNQDILKNTKPESSKVTLKSILLDLGLFQNTLGNIVILYRNFNEIMGENTFKYNKPITNDNIRNGLKKIKMQYISLIKLIEKDKTIILFKQPLIVESNNSRYDKYISYELIGMDKLALLDVQNRYYQMLDDLEIEFSNVTIFDANNILPKNLEYFEDHVHLQRIAQKTLGKALCNYKTN